MTKAKAIFLTLSIALGLSACGEAKKTETAAPSNPSAGEMPATGKPQAVATASSRFDAAVVARGAEVYRQNCAVCHGPRGEGAPNWQRKGSDGKMPPPPLDTNGHAWHHSAAWLKGMIQHGTVSRGGGMPAWGDKLSDADIEAVIVWMQSLWPEEIYQSWRAMSEKPAQEQKHKHKH